MRVGLRHERASLAAMPIANLGSEFDHFFNVSAEFFRHLSEVRWTSFGIALLCLLAMQLARAWAWRNVLRASYPDQRIPYLPLAAAYLAGAGINAVVPAHAGDVTKVFLVKRQIPGSSYPAVTSSFLVQTVFDTSVGILVLLYAISQGLLPPLPQIVPVGSPAQMLRRRPDIRAAEDQLHAATANIGASSSLLIAQMTFESFIPARC